MRYLRGAMRRFALLPVLAVAAAALAGCATHDANGSGDTATLRVSAAASLKQAFTRYGDAFTAARARFSFAGSDELAAQIRTGARPDVFASANSKLPDDLHDEGLVERPVTFAGNRLVIAVPAGSATATLKDLERKGTTLAIGSESVPIGSYTRTVLSKLPESESSAILRNVRSEEPDVAGIVGKLTQGAVDAGFVYVSDLRGADGKLRAIELPDTLQPTVAYGAAVVKGSKHAHAAKQFVDGLLDGEGRKALDGAGFEPPPAQ
jgi:molybdate transport system substrate-binding protein